MRKVVYMHVVSLDGYIESGRPAQEPHWGVSDESLSRHFNDLEQTFGAHLYGRRIYENLAAAWPAMGRQPSAPPGIVEYARRWEEKPKVVFSRTLQQVEWNARLVRENAGQEVTRLKEEPGQNLMLAGANLAATLIPLGLVDEYRLYINPVLLGCGKPMFPQLERALPVKLVDTLTFDCGVVMLHYSR